MGDERDSERFIDFAIAFMKEAKEDLEVANDLIEKKRYARSFSSSQQCIEKSTKALLEMEKIYIAEHDLSTFFVKFIYSNKEYDSYKKEVTELLEIIDYFEGEWSKTRYPREEKGKVVVSIDIYNADDAVEAYNKAEKCFNITKTILHNKFKLKI